MARLTPPRVFYEVEEKLACQFLGRRFLVLLDLYIFAAAKVLRLLSATSLKSGMCDGCAIVRSQI